MNVVHINNIDIVGRRFNGMDMMDGIKSKGVHCSQIVLEKLSGQKNVTSLLRDFEEPFLRETCKEFERSRGLQAMIYPYGWRLPENPKFRRADIAHYHLIHNNFISLAQFPGLVRAKPSVLTVHDPWMMTGHCVYPMECEKWKTGCSHCENLSRPFPMDFDNAANMWQIKKRVFNELDVDVVVASRYMREMAEKSPILGGLRIHTIPFGVDAELFRAVDAGKARAGLRLPKNNFTLLFRSDKSPFKGLELIKSALPHLAKTALAEKKRITLLTVGEIGLLAEYAKEFDIFEYGWVNDDARLAKLYAACDVFLMPSSAEAFGLMAVEAMASGKPVIVCGGTALPAVTFAPECGIYVGSGDLAALVSSIARLMNSPQECRKRGELGRSIAQSRYRFETYVNAHYELYRQILKRRL